MPSGMLKPKYIDQNSLPMEIVNDEILSRADDCYSLLGLQNNKILLLTQGRLFIRTANLKPWEEINIKGYRAAAMCRLISGDETERICIAWNANKGDQLPRFQIWEIKKVANE